MGDSLAASVFSSNLHQHGTLFLFAMNGCMTGRTQRNQIAGIVVRFVLVNMMHMEFMSPSFALLSTKLARPFIAILNLLAKTFPVGCVSPFRNATLPRGVVGAGDGAAQQKRLGQSALWYAVILHCFCNGLTASNKHFRNFLYGMVLRYIKVLQYIPTAFLKQRMRGILSPFLPLLAINFCADEQWARFTEERLSVFARHAQVVTRCVLLPFLVFADPFYRCVTTALAQRRGAIRLIDGFAWPLVAGFYLRAVIVLMLFKQILHKAIGASKVRASFFVGWIVSRGELSPIVFTNCNLGLLVEHAKRLSSHVLASGKAMTFDYASNSTVAATELISKLKADGISPLSLGS